MANNKPNFKKSQQWASADKGQLGPKNKKKMSPLGQLSD
jgi:hypothetical protein